MNVVGPESYKLQYTSTAFAVICPKGGSRFSDIAKSLMPKLYVASINRKPVYVGVTKRGMQQRLAHGWNAVGKSGYYGYPWRNEGTEADLDIWAHADAIDRSVRDIETVEAEVVYLLRLFTGQWPSFQTEIHFYASSNVHRHVAQQIVEYFGVDGSSAKLI